MFQEAVRKAVNEVLDGITGAKGLKALTEDERKPILSNLFKR
jgi:lysozyme family protein